MSIEIRRRDAGTGGELPLELSAALRRIYAARGVDAASLQLGLANMIPVSRLGGIEDAVARLLKAQQNREKVLILLDSWSSWNGFKFADYYYDVDYEYFCIRNTCGTYDICPMQKYLIEGDDALRMLNRLVTRDLNKLRDNRVTYVAWCTDSGRLIDDGTVFRLEENRYLLTCGSPCLA